MQKNTAIYHFFYTILFIHSCLVGGQYFNETQINKRQKSDSGLYSDLLPLKESSVFEEKEDVCWITHAQAFHNDLLVRYEGLLEKKEKYIKKTCLQYLQNNTQYILDIVLKDIEHLEFLEDVLHSKHAVIKCKNHAFWIALIRIRNALYSMPDYKKQKGKKTLKQVGRFFKYCGKALGFPFRFIKHLVLHVC